MVRLLLTLGGGEGNMVPLGRVGIEKEPKNNYTIKGIKGEKKVH